MIVEITVGDFFFFVGVVAVVVGFMTVGVWFFGKSS